MAISVSGLAALAALVGGVQMAGGAMPDNSPFATIVLDFAPAPGQFANNPTFNNPAVALGAPTGGGFLEPGNSSVVSIGGFGGSITLAFDHTVFDAPANPFGLDCIVFGNAVWVAGDPNRKWAEAGVIEISRDVNSNGLPDDEWFLIPGTHIPAPVSQTETQVWDDNFGDSTNPPANPTWVPPGVSGTWATVGFRLPSETFDLQILENPSGSGDEEVYGYADHMPTLLLGDTDVDNVIDDPLIDADTFYTIPDNPFKVGITPGSGGGNAFDIAWAIDPQTGSPAGLDRFDFIRITTGVNFVAGALGEVSTEIDAVGDVAEGSLGDAEGNSLFNLADFEILDQCMAGPDVLVPTSPCRVMDADQDGDVDLRDAAALFEQFDGT